jgi:hypothetical protein
MSRAIKYTIMLVAVCAICIVGVHHFHRPAPAPQTPYVDNTAYEQQKAACLAGQIKCNPVAPSAP